MKQIIILSIAFVLFSCSTNKQIAAKIPTTNQKISFIIPKTMGVVDMDSAFQSKLPFGKRPLYKVSPNINVYWDGSYILYVKKPTKSIYKNLEHEKGAMETAMQGTKGAKSEIKTINGRSFYFSSWQGGDFYRTSFKIYFGENSMMVAVESRKEDFQEAEELLMRILESIKVK